MADNPRKRRSRDDEPEVATAEIPPAEEAKVAVRGIQQPPVRGEDGQPQVTVQEPDKLVEVRPRVDIPRTSIGGKWYSFRTNVPVKVPSSVRDHLTEKGVL